MGKRKHWRKRTDWTTMESDDNMQTESTPKMQVISHTIKLHDEPKSQSYTYTPPVANQEQFLYFKNEQEYSDYVTKISTEGYIPGAKVKSPYDWQGVIIGIKTYKEYKDSKIWVMRSDPDILIVRKEGMTTPFGVGYNVTELTPI